MKSMQMLLVEDEQKHCDEYKKYVSTLKYPHSLYIVNGELEALKLIQMFPFDFLFLDLELHESDGDGISFLKKLKFLDIPKIPYIYVVTINPSLNARNYVRSIGADEVVWKGKSDYSAQFVVDKARDYFLEMVKSKSNEPGQITIYSIKNEIRSRIEKVGITDDIEGRNYLIEAIAIIIKSNDRDVNLKRDVYPKIAKMYSKSVWSIEKAIETAINKAWCITDEKTLAENYTAVVSRAKGSPTNKEFICYYANQIREERKA